MIKFLKHIILFLSLFFLIILIIIISSNKYINSKNVFFKIDNKKTHLILGHSHPEGAFDDNLIKRGKNLASSGELHFYTHLKIKKILKENSHIKNIFLEFTNNQITKDMETWTVSEEQILYNIPKYAPTMSLQDFGYVISKNPLAFLKSLQFVLKDNLNFLSNKSKQNFIKAKGWGGYNYMEKNHVDSLINAQRKGLVKIQDVSIFTAVNLKYLKRTVEVCKKNNVKLYLIRSPFHKAYLGFANENLFKKTLNSYFSDIPFIDLKDFPLKDTEYRDLDHLNYKGAKKVSIFFNDAIEEGIFEKENAEQLIKRKLDVLIEQFPN